MAVDSKKYLAEIVLNERRAVTYRSLSRALKVHSHVSKRMLYDFHHNENSKKPNSVNATYVITGVQHPPEPLATNGDSHESDGDDIMQSSPYISSSMPNQDAAADTVTTSSIILVRQEDLEDAKLTFRSISSIHVYSLQPAVLQDLNVLTDVSREMLAVYAHEDPLEYGKQWGMIQNQNVKRRTGARPPPPPAAASTKANPNTTVPAKRPLQSDSPNPEPSKPNDTADSKQPPQKGSSQPPSKPTAKPAPSKKEKSNLFSSFAKAKPKQKREEVAPAASGAELAAASGAEDLNLGDASEEEPEELFPDSGKPASTSNRESRKEREERLKKMMEDDDDEEQRNDADEEMPDVAEPEEEPEEPEEPAPIDEPPLPPKKQELKEEVTVQGGRRRGKRQVMKKKTVKDEEGYLVTREEPSWESFSEDEPAAPPPKKKPAVNAPKGKPGAKPGQGSIMSFFGKK